MKSLSAVILQATITLQLVCAIAGSDVTIFNNDETNEDAMDILLQKEHFMQVADQRNSKQSKFSVVDRRLHKQSNPQFNESETATSLDQDLSAGSDFSDINRQRSNYRKMGENLTQGTKWEDLNMYSDGGDEEELYGGRMNLPFGDGIHSRERRAADPGSGELGVTIEAVLNGTLSAQQQIDGSHENKMLKDYIQTALKNSLHAAFKSSHIDGVTVLSLTPPYITFTAEILYNDTAITMAHLAEFLHQLDLKDNFKVGGAIHTFSSPLLSSSAKNLQAVICFLCKQYESCRQARNVEWQCGVYDDALYPFGFDENDSTLPPDEEFVSAKIEIQSSFPFEDTLVKSLYISVNGLISFGEEFTSFSPEPLPVANDVGHRRMILCPYWTDLDKVHLDVGQVFYQTYRKGPYISTEVQAVLDRANKDVATYSEDVSIYDASAVVKVTWSEMPPSPADEQNSERVTFQCIIITDGETTYVMYMYAQGAMTFDPTMGREVQVGLGDKNLDSSKINYYHFHNVTGNTGKLGQWFFKVGYVPNNRAKCIQWYHTNILHLTEINAQNLVIPPCPCNELSARQSFLWIPSKLQTSCYDVSPLYGQYGRRCCYRNDTGFSFENRIPASGNFQNYTPYYGDLISHEMSDAAPKRWCCDDITLCQLYYDVRPVRPCEAGTTVRGVLFGDPHVVTLDSQSFIFNGLGEYRLLEIDGKRPDGVHIRFMLQGRTCRIEGKDRKLLNATVFCSLALQNTNGQSLRVEISHSRSYMVIYANEQDFSAKFRDTPSFRVSHGGIFMQRVNEALKVSTPDDIGLSITLNNNMLDFSVEISTKYQGMTKGLLGNFNYNSTDDFLFPNGTVLPNTTNERHLYDYGKTWAVTTSIFTYEPGTDASFYSDPNFMPIFLEESDATELAAAHRFCAGVSNLPCIYDYIATQSEIVAKSSRETITTFHEDEGRASNKPPIITGTTHMNLTLKQPSMLTMTGTDPDNDGIYFEVVSSPINGFQQNISGNIFSATYVPVDLNPVSIGVAAKDSSWHQSSEVAQVTIRICGGCVNGGSCNFSRVVNSTDAYFSVVGCDCKNSWSGDKCDKDKDGCANKPCPFGTNCTDVPASVEDLTKKAYNCSDCPKGFQLSADRTKCEDIDECNQNPHPCDPNAADCINRNGGYTCACKHGYRSDGKNGCKDIDECVEHLHTCDQICNNTVGAFHCECEEGYKLDSVFGFNCTAVDPCQNQIVNCSYGCSILSGQARCFCQPGYQLKNDGLSCEDRDECKENLCSQKCENTDGSFRCSCYPGFYLTSDTRSCQVCSENKYGSNCERMCDCRGRGIRCDNVKGCICSIGWTGEYCEQDVDECTSNVDKCSREQFCTNTDGSYTCTCHTGYVDKYNDGNCVNVNECEDPLLNRCQHVCVDSPGSFACICNDGYNSVNNNCQDIDECETGASGCQQICENTAGSFNCKCNEGFYLDFDRKTCFKDKDPCQESGPRCSYGCMVVNGKPTCYCPSGYELQADGVTCSDIDECRSNAHKCTEGCKNIPGSYICTCPVGFHLLNDQRTCQGCDMYHWGPGCANECTCNPKGTSTCDPVKGCKCHNGWSGTNCDLDKNECLELQSPCNEFATCINTFGSFTCRCNPGFHIDTSGKCSDIDECSRDPCEQICTNTKGSYSCSCHSGFKLKDGKCLDIDECSVPDLNGCDQLCRNTQGSFACECYEGYLLNTTTRNTCYQKSLIQQCGANSCSHFCLPINGKDECMCRFGYQLKSDKVTCENIDECASNPCISGTCTDRIGTFNCSCAEGMKLSADKTTCKVCEPGFFGKDCQNNCICSVMNTERCLPSNGICECKEGWEGTDCSTDVNECQNLSKANCKDHTSCINTKGSYKCVCDVGFYHTNFGCVACDVAFYGQDCLQKCPCVMANTKDCNDTTGECTCNSGWNGTNCEVDIDECAVNSTYCPGVNDTCFNLNGSAECRCDVGLYRPYTGEECQACDDTFYGQDCLQKCACVMANTKDCNDTTGECTCNSGWNGTNCEVDIDECAVNSTYCPGVHDTCFNLNGSAECRCDRGYYRPYTREECQDIDECEQSANETCEGHNKCVNTDGACACIAGYLKNTSKCADSLLGYDIQITFLYEDDQINKDIFNTSTQAFTDMAEMIKHEVIAYGTDIVGSALLTVKVLSFSHGSVIAKLQPVLDKQHDILQHKNPASEMSKIVWKIISDKYMTLNGTKVRVGPIAVQDKYVPSSARKCDIHLLFEECPASQVCVEDSVTCQPVQERKNNLLLGLAVGIPSFAVLVVISAILACLYVRRKKKQQVNQELSDGPSEDFEAPFRNRFATRASTKGSWGDQHRFYRPDEYSEPGVSESGDLFRQRQREQLGFMSSSWYDGFKSSRPKLSGELRAPSEVTETSSNNFWVRMARNLDPYKNFEMRRPNFNLSPNRTLTITEEQRPDSTT